MIICCFGPGMERLPRAKAGLKHWNLEAQPGGAGPSEERAPPEAAAKFVGTAVR